MDEYNTDLRSITMHYLHMFIFYFCSYLISMLDPPFFLLLSGGMCDSLSHPLLLSLLFRPCLIAGGKVFEKKSFYI